MSNVKFLLNAFSLSMVAEMTQALSHLKLSVTALTLEEARDLVTDATSAVGHAPTASIFALLLQRDVLLNRISVKLTEGETAVVGQYIGPRLDEGATSLPEGATIEWYLVAVGDVDISGGPLCQP